MLGSGTEPAFDLSNKTRPIETQTLIIRPTPTKVKRAAQSWTTQTSPVWELRLLSQHTDATQLLPRPNFVYQKEAGEGVYIYHVEFGINTQSDVSKVLSGELYS
jgi:hypothetical protein